VLLLPPRLQVAVVAEMPAAVVVPILVAVEDAEAAVEPAELEAEAEAEAEAEPVVVARIQIATIRWSGNNKFNYTRGLEVI